MPAPMTTSSPSSERLTTFAPLRVPAYRRIWAASVVNNLGTFLQLTAAPWLMNELTGSPLMVALVTTALTLPRLLLTLPAGVLSDVLDRRTLIITGQAISLGAVSLMAALTLTGGITPALLLGLTFALGVGTATQLPAFQTLVPDLVDGPLRAQAITLNSAAFNVARAVGPSIGGLMVAAGLTGAAFGVNAATYLAVTGVLLTHPRQPVEDRSGTHLWQLAATGVRYVRFTPEIRVLVALAAAFMVTAASVQSLLPSVASDDLALGAGGFGLLYAAFGVGALGAVVGRERMRARLGTRMLPGSILVHGLAGVGFGLAPSGLVAGAWLVISGATWVWTLITLNASIQILAPRWVRGRVVSLYLLAIGLQPLGALLAGALAELVGAGDATATMTALTALLGLVALRLDLPLLGEIAEPTAPSDWVIPRHAEHVAGTPVLVITTFEIDPDRAEEFMDVLRRMRRVRFTTGAYRWSLFRDADRPQRITEFFSVWTWEEHLAQHARLDDASAAVLRLARSFDTAGGPITRHLAGLDIVDAGAAPLAEQMLTVHSEAHASDGSMPL